MHQINRRTFLSWSTTMLASLAVSGCGSPTTPKVTPTTAVTIVEPTATPEVVTTLNFTTGIETNTQDFRLRELILVEAIRRLGLKGKLTSYPYNHAIELVDQGKADGDMGRIYNFNEKGDHPNYLRVEEPFQDLSIVGFAIKEGIELNGWNSLKDKGDRVAYHRGHRNSELNLPKVMTEDKLVQVDSMEQGLNMLSVGRFDIYVASNLKGCYNYYKQSNLRIQKYDKLVSWIE